LIGDAVAKKVEREMKKAGLTLEDRLGNLEKQRRRDTRAWRLSDGGWFSIRAG
jgi:hypothetical protein